MTNYDILSTIDSINDAALDAEMAVLESMIESYSKATMILENYEGEEIDSFDIFSESYYQEADENTGFRRLNKDGKKESLIMSILKAIPRLFDWLGKKIKSLWNKRPAAKLKKEVADLKNVLADMDSKTKSELDKLRESTWKSDLKNLRTVDKRIKIGDKAVRNQIDVAISSLQTQINDMKKTTNDNNRKIRGLQDDSEVARGRSIKLIRRIDSLEDAVGAHIVASENSYVTFMDFDATIKDLNKMVTLLDKFSKYNFHKPSSAEGIYEMSKEVRGLTLGIVADRGEESGANKRASKGRRKYTLDEVVDKAGKIETLATTIHDRAIQLSEKLDKELKSYKPNAIHENSPQQLKIETTEDLLKSLKDMITATSFMCEDAHSTVTYSAKYVEMYKKVASLYATGMAPYSADDLHFDHRADFEEAQAILK